MGTYIKPHSHLLILQRQGGGGGMHNHIHTIEQFSISLTPLSSCFWTVRKEKPAYSERAHANTGRTSTQMVESNSGPSCCDATVPTTWPPYCQYKATFVFFNHSGNTECSFLKESHFFSNPEGRHVLIIDTRVRICILCCLTL